MPRSQKNKQKNKIADKTRRKFIASCAATGLATSAFTNFEQEQSSAIDSDSLAQAEKVAGLEFSGREREQMLDAVNDALEDYSKLRKPRPHHANAPDG